MPNANAPKPARPFESRSGPVGRGVGEDLYAGKRGATTSAVRLGWDLAFLALGIVLVAAGVALDPLGPAELGPADHERFAARYAPLVARDDEHVKRQRRAHDRAATTHERAARAEREAAETSEMFRDAEAAERHREAARREESDADDERRKSDHER
jgi:hypothetical protein